MKNKSLITFLVVLDIVLIGIGTYWWYTTNNNNSRTAQNGMVNTQAVATKTTSVIQIQNQNQTTQTAETTTTPTTQTTAATSTTPATTTTTASKSYPLADVKKHNTESDCWTIVNSKVYDVTEFIPSHPGGEAIVKACGIDGTRLFDGERAHQRENAQGTLDAYYIGDKAN